MPGSGQIDVQEGQRETVPDGGARHAREDPLDQRVQLPPNAERPGMVFAQVAGAIGKVGVAGPGGHPRSIRRRTDSRHPDLGSPRWGEPGAHDFVLAGRTV